MFYQITEENLKYAFLKLKSYKSSLRLKKEIVDFENQYNNNPNLFKQIEDEFKNCNVITTKKIRCICVV